MGRTGARLRGVPARCYTATISVGKEQSPMPVAVQSPAFPVGASVDITIRVQARLNISSLVAQQRVNVLLIESLGDRLGAGEPELVVGERLHWRVPVRLHWLGHEPMGPVGQVEVDAETGEVLVSPRALEELRRNAERFAASATP